MATELSLETQAAREMIKRREMAHRMRYRQAKEDRDGKAMIEAINEARADGFDTLVGPMRTDKQRGMADAMLANDRRLLAQQQQLANQKGALANAGGVVGRIAGALGALGQLFGAPGGAVPAPGGAAPKPAGGEEGGGADPTLPVGRDQGSAHPMDSEVVPAPSGMTGEVQQITYYTPLTIETEEGTKSNLFTSAKDGRQAGALIKLPGGGVAEGVFPAANLETQNRPGAGELSRGVQARQELFTNYY